MAPQVDRLTRIGIESFALIEDSHGGRPYITRRSGRLPSTQVHQHHHLDQHQQTFIYYEPQISTVRMPEITRNEVAQYYGTAVNVPVLTSDEAAKYYGGFVIVEHGRKKQFLSAY